MDEGLVLWEANDNVTRRVQEFIYEILTLKVENNHPCRGPGTVGPLKCGALEVWGLGSVGLWKCGALEVWGPETVGPWKCGALELWGLGSVGPWNFGALCNRREC